MGGDVGQRKVVIHWFRHGLRLHDNPALLEAIQDADEFYPIFIFDGESAGTKLVGYKRLQFLLESLQDLDSRLRAVGGKLFLFKGNPCSVFKKFSEEKGLKKISFEEDCEPIWQERDVSVKVLCEERGIEYVERVSHTLWDPATVIETNGGYPPLTYEMFVQVTSAIGKPPRPVGDVDWSKVKFGELAENFLGDFEILNSFPKPEDFGKHYPTCIDPPLIRWKGGETAALKHLEARLKVEEAAFREGYYLPTQSRPDLLGPPMSLSAALRFGCVSVRRFYWNVHDIFNRIHAGEPQSNQSITGQLMWREYFYTMSVSNPFYAEMEKNPICLDIPWYRDEEKLQRWKEGKTGYPFIDAAMRQLVQEGWIHHVARNAVACFLTRGDLWISWEDGLNFFLEHLLDADWSVCAGNWMWVSSSAFERVLDCSQCVCPVNYGRRLDPWGEYIRRYVPELRAFPVEYIYEPWKAPFEVQESAKCIVGKDYPKRIVVHKDVSERNRKMMLDICDALSSAPPHCCPSNEEETRSFMWLPQECEDHVCSAR